MQIVQERPTSPGLQSDDSKHVGVSQHKSQVKKKKKKDDDPHQPFTQIMR